MKRTWILILCSTAAFTVNGKAQASEIVAQDNDIEVETVMAESDASLQNAEFLSQKVDQEKLDTELNAAESKKAVIAARSQQFRAEAQIAKAEKEIASLQADQKELAARRHAAEVDRVRATRKLVVMIQQIK